jgi:hypothetical protein
MLDAAIGPRLEANSLRIRSVFSAAGTFDVAFGPAVAVVAVVVRAAVVAGMRPLRFSAVSGIPYLRMRLIPRFR